MLCSNKKKSYNSLSNLDRIGGYRAKWSKIETEDKYWMISLTYGQYSNKSGLCIISIINFRWLYCRCKSDKGVWDGVWFTGCDISREFGAISDDQGRCSPKS